MSRAVMQQALEALENDVMQRTYAGGVRIANAAIALRQALAEPEQEPVASLMTNIKLGDQKVVWNDDGFDRALWHETPLYTAPTPRKPLSDEQIMSIDVLRYHFALNGGAGPISKKGKEIIDAIERAHGIGEQHE